VTDWLNDVAWFDGRFYAVGTRGTVISSADLVTWEPEPGITQKSLYALVAAEKQMVAAGIEGIILRAQRGDLVIPQYEHANGTNRFRLTTKPGRRVRLDRSSDLSEFSNLAEIQSLDNTGEIAHQSATNQPPSREFYRAAILP
jgi:hypothetical protein